MTEWMVLDLLRQGVYTFVNQRLHKSAKVISCQPNVQGYLYSRIYCTPYVISIGLHRVSWMARHDQLIPPGFEIHHIDLDRENNDADNLVALAPFDHRKFHLETEEVPF